MGSNLGTNCDPEKAVEKAGSAIGTVGLPAITQCCAQDDSQANAVFEIPPYENITEAPVPIVFRHGPRQRAGNSTDRDPHAEQTIIPEAAFASHKETPAETIKKAKPTNSTQRPSSSAQKPQPDLEAILKLEKKLGAEQNEQPAKVQHKYRPSLDNGADSQVYRDQTPNLPGREERNTETQCGCLPSAKVKPSEETILRRFFFCYCCCCGGGWSPFLDPLMTRWSCCFWHCSCQSADVFDKAEGICGHIYTCCCAALLCHFPLPEGSPSVICCNERCCTSARSDAGGSSVDDANMGRRASVTWNVHGQEAAGNIENVLNNAYVPCFCCCCGMTQASGIMTCCGCAQKSGCWRCDARFGMPNYPGCTLLSLCCGGFCQCRWPTVNQDAPACVCCGIASDFEGLVNCCPKKNPEWCANVKCCSCSEVWGNTCDSCCYCWRKEPQTYTGPRISELPSPERRVSQYEEA